MLAYLSRYTHRVAVSNRRLIAADEDSVTFKVKDWRLALHIQESIIDREDLLQIVLSLSNSPTLNPAEQRQ